MVLQEYDPSKSFHGSSRYTGRQLSAEIGYITGFEQQPGFVVFSLIGVEPYSGK